MTTMTHTGRTATASGILMLAGIEGEWLLNPQADDGTVTNLPVFALLLLTATTGFVLLALAVLGLRTQTATSKTAQAGSLMTLAGACLMVTFGLTSLASAVLTGSPLEIAFLAFLIGMLLLAVGPITWALALRRHPPAPAAWQMLLLAVGPITWALALRRHPPAPAAWQMLLLSGAATFAALALEADPWHDLALATMFTAWTILGVLLLRTTNTTPANPARINSHA